MPRLMPRFIPLALIGAFVLTSGACTFMAVVKPGATRVLTVKSSDMPAAATQIGEAAKEVGFKYVRVNTKTGIVVGQRGYGYTQYTSLTVQVKSVGPDAEVTIGVKSSDKAEAVVDEVIAALSKRVKL